MQKVLLPKDKAIRFRGASEKHKRRCINLWPPAKNPPTHRVYRVADRYQAIAPFPARRTNLPLSRKQRPISKAFWVNEVGSGIIALTIGAYIVDAVCHLQGYFLAAVWLVLCLPILGGAALWMKSRRRQCR